MAIPRHETATLDIACTCGTTPWLMMVDSSATTGRPAARACATSGDTLKAVSMRCTMAVTPWTQLLTRDCRAGASRNVGPY